MAGRRTTTPLTDAERRERAERTAMRLRELHAQLVDQVRAVSSGADWQRFLSLAGHFHTDSAANVWLIMAQRPDATLVASYDAWQTAGRQVRKGERSITVVAPVVRTDDTGETAVSVVADRAPTHLFDISQTDGPALPTQPPVRLLAGAAHHGLWDSIATPAIQRGWSIERGHVEDGANGSISPADKRIVVRGDLDDRQAVKTLAHELGHVLLRHDAGTHRGLAEIEAESVAYVVLAAHGVDTGDFSLPYVAGWGYASHERPDEVVRATAARVVMAAHTILDAAPPPAGIGAQLGDRTALARLAARSAEARHATAAIADRAELRAAQTKRPAHRRPVEVVEPQPPTVGRDTHVRDTDTPQPQLIEPAWRLDRLEAANRDAAAYFSGALARNSTTRKYLADRLGPDGGRAVAGWTLGYAPANWTGAVDWLRRAGHTDERIVDSGIGVIARNGRLVDRFRDRVMIGVHDENGRLAGFVGRDMSGADQRRYLNTPANALYAKAELLIGLHEQRDQWAGCAAVLVEGPFDAMAVAATPGNRGRLAAVAPSGTAVTPAQLALLDRTLPPGRELVLALDADPAGRAAALRTAELALHMDRPVYVTRLPDGQDPAAYAHDVGTASLAAYLGEPRRRPALDVLVEARIERHAGRLQWVEGQVDAARDVAALLATVPATSTVDVTLRAAEMIGVSPMLLHDEIGAIRDRTSASSERLAERAADLTLRSQTGADNGAGALSPAQLAGLGAASRDAPVTPWRATSPPPPQRVSLGRQGGTERLGR